MNSFENTCGVAQYTVPVSQNSQGRFEFDTLLDAPLKLYTVHSRKASQMQRSPATLRSFVKRVQESQGLPYTHAEYMALPKPQQDEQKDIGGYILGELKDGGRKVGDIISRSAAVLDLDNLPAGGTDEVCKRCMAFGSLIVLYSTAKHTLETPRLRVIVPFNRDVTPEEYAFLVRWIAHELQPEMSWFDSTTAEPTRFMYWPAHCSDVEPVFRIFGEAGILDVDAVFEQNSSWEDIMQWPRFPKEATAMGVNAKSAKQADPTAKTGIVGAFCRTFDIEDVIEEFLPDIYKPCETSGRYTYLGGSTTGGGVVYEHGKFLYSFHSTDPASNRQCNSFDLLRIHKFGKLDATAPAGTPSYQLPSYKAMVEFARSLPAVAELERKEAGARVLQDFADDLDPEQSEQSAERLGAMKDAQMTTKTVFDALHAFGITTRLNVISNKAIITGCPESWSEQSAVNNLPTHLRDILKKAGVKGIAKDAMCDSLSLINDEKRFNPVVDMMQSQPWDQTDRLHTIYEILGQTNAFAQTLIRKWLWQCVAMAHNDGRSPYGADGVLTLTGPQGIGKTSFFRWVACDPLFFKGGIRLNINDKDSILGVTSAWICELGELDGTLKLDDIANLKAFITKEYDSIRPPYARNTVDRPRYASLCATVNSDEFLRDSTGNRRFWTVIVECVDLDKMRALDAQWVQQLWAQMLQLYLQDPQGFRLTKEEQLKLEKRNGEHLQKLRWEDEIEEQLDRTLPLEKWTEVTAARVAKLIPSFQCEAISAGRVLKKFARRDPRFAEKYNSSTRIYLIPLKNVDNSEDDLLNG